MMNGGVSSAVSSQSSSSSFYSILQNRTFSSNSQFSPPLIANYPHNRLPNCANLSFSSRSHSPAPIHCSNSPGSGESDSKTVLDAFFLGKALGEALTERLESTVGEFLSTIGRLQAEQQKQVQDFQEEVLEKAKRAQEKAAREALEDQGRLISNTNLRNVAETSGGSTSAMGLRTGSMNPASAARVVNQDGPALGGVDNSVDSDPLSSIPIDE